MKFKNILNKPYKYGFKLNLSTNVVRGGLNLKLIEELKILNKELLFITKLRESALKTLFKLKAPDWNFSENPDINYDSLIYYSKPKITTTASVLLTETFKKLGFSLTNEQTIKNIALDIIFDSVSVLNTIKPYINKFGIIFISLFEAINMFPYLVFRYINTTVPVGDNFFSTINSVVFSEGSFCYIPKDVVCDFNLSTYFRTNTKNFAQFERTLLIAGHSSSVFYIEGCTAPVYKESQLHIAIVEIIVKNNAFVKYITVQNWYKGNSLGEGGIYNFTTKRGQCSAFATLEWLQVEVGSSITWKYPSSILRGDFSKSSFYSISFVSEFQVADTGSKIFHIGHFTKSNVLSKSISLNSSKNIYRGLIEVAKHTFGVINKTECDSLLFGKNSLTATIPYSGVYNYSTNLQQEAFISRVDENYLFFLKQRGVSLTTAISLLVNSFCIDIYSKLPLEFISEIPALVFNKIKDIYF